jgi:hypothetical protein
MRCNSSSSCIALEYARKMGHFIVTTSGIFIIYLFMCDLFNETISSSADYITSNDRMINE